MSEFSDSFHVRVADRRTVSQRLAKAGIVAAIFPPKNGWCTFVPFEEDDRTLEEFARLLSLPILRYQYAEDYGWAFAMAQEGDICLSYDAWWHEAPRVNAQDLNMKILEVYLRPTVDARHLEARLREATVPEIGQEPLAYAFASALGLPKFRWLSPHYVTVDFKAGTLPKSTKIVGAPDSDPILPQPDIDFLALPRTDLSAIEALEALTPTFLAWDPKVYSDLISSGGGDLKRREIEGPMISSQGRTEDHGGWVIRFVSEHHGVIVLASITSAGKVTCKVLTLGENSFMPLRTESCMDSTKLMQLTEPLYLQWREPDTPPLFDRIAYLHPEGNSGRWVWSVMYFCWSEGLTRRDLNLMVDAVTGDVVQRED